MEARGPHAPACSRGASLVLGVDWSTQRKSSRDSDRKACPSFRAEPSRVPSQPIAGRQTGQGKPRRRIGRLPAAAFHASWLRGRAPEERGANGPVRAPAHRRYSSLPTAPSALRGSCDSVSFRVVCTRTIGEFSRRIDGRSDFVQRFSLDRTALAVTLLHVGCATALALSRSDPKC